MGLDSKRWLILLAGILANVCQGAAYASSVFAKPMLSHLGLTVMKNGLPAPDMTKWALAFSINLTCLPIGMLLSGRIADRRGPRIVIAVGGLLFALGVFLAGYSNSLAWFCATFGVMMGLGSGAAYGSIVAASVKWFPDMRGLAAGLSVGALGIGTSIIALTAPSLMGMASNPDTAVLFALKVLGIAFLVIISLASIVIVSPPAGYKPAGFSPATSAAGASSHQDIAWAQMLARGRFWLLYLIYACGAFSGLMIISQASPIAQTMTKDIMSLGDPKLIAAAGASVAFMLGVANALGRVIWGFISDKIGRTASLAAMFLITGVAMFLLPSMVLAKTSFLVSSLFIGVCYGGYLGVFPSICADEFGPKNLTVNYGLLFSAFSVAAIAGPQVGGQIFKASGSYNQAFVIAGAVCIAGLLLTILSGATQKKAKAA